MRVTSSHDTLASSCGRAVAIAVCLIAAQGPARAQDYPSKPVRILVGYAAGGTTDLLARFVSAQLGTRLGQTFVVENRPGANGALAAQALIASSTDGYTLMMAPSGPITVEPAVRKPQKYDPLTAFAPISMVAKFPFILVAGDQQPFNTGPELVAYAKAHSGKMSYASAGTGSVNHMGSEYFKLRTGIDIVHVPYKGDSASVTDLIGNRVSFNMFPAPVAIPIVTSGKVKAIAVLDTSRVAQLPKVPTLAEQGMPGFEIGSWIGVFAPAGTAPAIVDKLNRELNALFKSAEGQQQLALGSMTNQGLSPVQFDAQIRRETARWKEVGEKAHITLED